MLLEPEITGVTPGHRPASQPSSQISQGGFSPFALPCSSPRSPLPRQPNPAQDQGPNSPVLGMRHGLKDQGRVPANRQRINSATAAGSKVVRS